MAAALVLHYGKLFAVIDKGNGIRVVTDVSDTDVHILLAVYGRKCDRHRAQAVASGGDVVAFIQLRVFGVDFQHDYNTIEIKCDEVVGVRL